MDVTVQCNAGWIEGYGMLQNPVTYILYLLSLNEVPDTSNMVHMLREVGRLESKAEDACATLSIDAANALPSSLSSELRWIEGRTDGCMGGRKSLPSPKGRRARMPREKANVG